MASDYHLPLNLDRTQVNQAALQYLWELRIAREKLR